MEKKLLTGNEAIARGAYEAGVSFASGYPGTPSTEILENTAEYDEIYAQWSPNEKVALEVGIGAAIAGKRVMVTMKHVGINVAADPLFTFSYTGVNGGLVLACADDPGMHSSQNEQDSRNYARFAKFPVFEPSDSQEAKEMVGAALDLSEKHDTPVLLRSTTRISHAHGLVELNPRKDPPERGYSRNRQKYVMIPAYGRRRHEIIEDRLDTLQAESEEHPANHIEWKESRVGIITSSISYQYVKEAFPELSCLKLGLSYPLPAELIRRFCGELEEVFIVEELDSFLEDNIRLLGIDNIRGSDLLPRTGEFDPNLIAEALAPVIGDRTTVNIPEKKDSQTEELPARPPVMCPGCPHRGVFYILSRLNLKVTGDIGCYTLGTLPPLEAMDTCICMGASIGVGIGMSRVDKDLARETVAVIGDSTFFHSGLTGIVDMVYNQNPATVIVLDNRTTAMTGHQDHPGTGLTLKKEPTTEIDITEAVRGLGVKRVTELDPFDLEGTREAIENELAADEPSVLIFKRPCALLVRDEDEGIFPEIQDCTGCQVCMDLGCPALVLEDATVRIDTNLCTDCGLCIGVCPSGAIQEGESEDA